MAAVIAKVMYKIININNLEILRTIHYYNLTCLICCCVFKSENEVKTETLDSIKYFSTQAEKKCRVSFLQY